MLELGADGRRVLLAVLAGRVRRGPVGRGGPQYLLDGVDGIDHELPALAAEDLVVLGRGAAPPKLTPDGEWVLTNFT
jgi:hypothetical protein